MQAVGRQVRDPVQEIAMFADGEILGTTHSAQVGPSEIDLEDQVARHFGTLHRPGYTLILAAIDPTKNKELTQIATSDPKEAVEFAMHWDGRRNLYISTALFDPVRGVRRRIEDVAAYQGLLLDLDPDSTSHEVHEARALDVLGSVIADVSEIVGRPRVQPLTLFSGRGAQALVLGEAIPLASASERIGANGGNKSLLARIALSPAVKDSLGLFGFELDTTGDISRLMRLAGTVNLKTDLRAYLYEGFHRPERSEWLSPLVVELDRSQCHQPAREQQYRVPGPPPDWVMALVQSNPTLRAMFEANMRGNDRSRHELRFARRFLEVATELNKTVSRDDLAALLLAMPHGKARHPKGSSS